MTIPESQEIPAAGALGCVEKISWCKAPVAVHAVAELLERPDKPWDHHSQELSSPVSSAPSSPAGLGCLQGSRVLQAAQEMRFKVQSWEYWSLQSLFW